MIFKEIILENFGIYKGLHTIDLSVVDGKPVILIGGLNGGGKTTFLDAFQLVLYGKHAKCSNRGHQAYGSFLASTKNKFALDSDAVELSLTFTHRTDNDIREFKVIRCWKVNQKHEAKDSVQVFCNGELDSHLSQYWDDFVNEFIPLSLSDLFFFDGDKIENLAHPERSAELVKTGIENLLGLDLLSQLQIDLSNVEKKRKGDNLNQSVMRKVSECEDEIGLHNAIISDLKKEVALLEQQASDNNLAINKARQAVRQAGAHLIDERDSIKYELGAIESKIRANKADQVKIASGASPLKLIQGLISETKIQIELEEKAQQAKVLDSAISDYEESLIKSLKLANAPTTALDAVSQTMLNLSNKRNELTQVDCYLNSDLSIFNGLNEQIESEQIGLERLNSDAAVLLETKALYEKKLETIPDYETVQHLLTNLAEIEFKSQNVLETLNQKQQLLDQSSAKGDALAQRYSNLLTQQNSDTFEQKRAIEVAEHIRSVKETMATFSHKLIAENIQRLECLIKQKFDTLGRKENLISALQIDPNNFEITLFDINHHALMPSNLSAGERQLLAISILWGLAEASGKEIPTVIDTPLGRLDGQHRTKLVDHYFPQASKQIILLSTDEEIYGDYYKQLTPSIGREYQIHYDEQQKTTCFTEGYLL